MAISATIFKIEFQIADLDRHYYQTHSLTLARHPSETDERMMVRVLAFARHASESLCFGKGLSTEDEPDLWSKSLSGEIQCWIEIGQPDEKLLRRACGHAQQVFVYSYGDQSLDNWWQHHQRKLKHLDKLTVYRIPSVSSQALVQLVKRTMQLQCTLQEGEMLFTDGDCSLTVVPQLLKAAA